MMTLIMICHAIMIDKNKKQYLSHANNHVIFDNRATDLMFYPWVAMITHFYANNVSDNARWVAHPFLCSNMKIWWFLTCDTPLWHSCKDGHAHVGCSVSWARKTHQNANVCKNFMLGLIHWDHYNARYTVVSENFTSQDM